MNSGYGHVVYIQNADDGRRGAFELLSETLFELVFRSPFGVESELACEIRLFLRSFLLGNVQQLVLDVAPLKREERSLLVHLAVHAGVVQIEAVELRRRVPYLDVLFGDAVADQVFQHRSEGAARRYRYH